MLNQPLLVQAHFEEVVFFFDPFGFCEVIGAFAFHQFLFRVKAFASGAIKSSISGVINLALLINAGQDIAHHFFVPFLGGPDEVVGLDMERGPQISVKGADFVRIFPGLALIGLCGAKDFVSVFIRAGEKIGLIPEQAVITPHHVAQDGGIGMAYMGFGVDIVNRRCEVNPLFHDKNILLQLIAGSK
jgi:hypothetical protein